MKLGSRIVSGLALAPLAFAYKVKISSADEERQICSGMWAGKAGNSSEKTSIELSFTKGSGQLALVIYEWSDVDYLGVPTPSYFGSEGESEEYLPRTYICTTSAYRSGLCSQSSLGEFIINLPTSSTRNITLNDTSIYTTALKFASTLIPSSASTTIHRSVILPRQLDAFVDDYDGNGNEDEDESDFVNSEVTSVDGVDTAYATDETLDSTNSTLGSTQGALDDTDDTYDDVDDDTLSSFNSTIDDTVDYVESGDDLDEDVAEGEAAPTLTYSEEYPSATPTFRYGYPAGTGLKSNGTLLGSISDDDYDTETETETEAETNTTIPVDAGTMMGLDDYEDLIASGTYEGGVLRYTVTKTGYYCIGAIPVTLVAGSSNSVQERANSSSPHAEYEGTITFNNVFEGQLPAADYPKIKFYLFLTCLYIVMAIGWGALCFKHKTELLPIQYYLSGTLGYLVIEMGIYWIYYRYLNAHGTGASATAFLLVVSTLNAGRNSLSFFLLLVVSMGLSVVTPSLGPIMSKVKVLTAAHFIFGVIYSIGTVEITLETASLLLILSLIVGLSFTLTSFLMWTAVSLNGTILHLEKRKQHYKLHMFKQLNMILWVAVILIAGFFVISTISISDRASDDYAPRSWRYRWFLLDGSLSLIYMGVFGSIAWLWRPTGNNMRFAMSEELVQDEAEADADDYELSNRPGGPDHPGEDDDDDLDETKRLNGGDGRDRQVVFAIEDEDEEENGFRADNDDRKREGDRLIGKDRTD